jgi:hypothetical protein
MNWKKTLILGLVFGVAGLGYAAWKAREDRKQARRRKIASLDGELCSDCGLLFSDCDGHWCVCDGEHTCEGHRA